MTTKTHCIHAQNSQREKKSMDGLRKKNEWTKRGMLKMITNKGVVTEGGESWCILGRIQGCGI